MSRPSTTSTSTNSANAFPRPAGVSLLAPEPAVGHLSPSRSTFSFESSPQSNTERGPSFEHSKRPSSRNAQAAPGVQPNRSRRRTQYFEEQFAYKDDSTSSARDRVTRDAPIIAELRTNVIIKDEYTLVTDLSHHLSTRYQRPESSIMITVNHSACLLLGGSFEPTYVLTITALPVQVQQTTNKRNAALIQNFLIETLGVPLDRGIIKFVPIQEECLATNGTTILGEIEKLERQQGEEGGLKRALTKSSKRSAVAKAKSSFQLSRKASESQTDIVRSVVTPPIPSPSPLDSGVAVDREESDTLQPLDGKFANKSTVNRPVSRAASEKTNVNFATIIAPPPVPKDAPPPKVGKRKSMMAIFRR